MNIHKIAEGMHMIADGLVEDADTKSKRVKTSAAHALVADKTAEIEELVSKKDPTVTNVYQILLDHVGGHFKTFDVHHMTRHRDNNPFKHCSLQRLLAELKKLEVDKLAAATEETRQHWILLKP